MKRLALTSVLFLLSAAACGDDEVIPDGPGPSPDAAATDGGNQPVHTVFAVSGDFSSGTGIASTINVTTRAVSTNVVAGVVSSDPVVRHFGDQLIVVNRFGQDNVVVLNASDRSLVEQVSIGANSNPQDVAVANGKIYVATYAGDGVSIISANDLAGGVTGTIDLSASDPGDDDPNCASVVSSGGMIYVSCQLLDSSFVPREEGIIAVIDPSDDSVIATLTLTHENPFSFLVATPTASAFGGDVLVATTPDFASYTDGCIERITGGSAPALIGCLVTNATLGGYVSDLVIVGDQVAAAITTCQGGDCFGNPSTSDIAMIDEDGAVDSKLMTASSHPTDIAVCPGTEEMIVADTDYADSPGVRIYSAAGVEQTSAPLDVGLPPAFTNGLVCF